MATRVEMPAPSEPDGLASGKNRCIRSSRVRRVLVNVASRGETSNRPR